MADYSATALVRLLLERGYIPRGDRTFTTERLLELLSDELRSYVVDLLREAATEHHVVPHLVQVVAGQDAYRLPPRAVANGIRRVSVVRGGYETQLPQLRPDALDGRGQGYYFRGARMVLWPMPTEAMTLRMDYLLRPSQLVNTGYGVVQSVTESGGLVSIQLAAHVPTLGARVDVVRAQPSFDPLGLSLVASQSGAGLVTGIPRSALQELPEVGDYVCTEDTSPVAQVPLELHPLLAQRAAWSVLTAIGDAGAPAAYERAEGMRAQALRLLTPRDIGARQFVGGRMALSRGRRW